MTLALALICRHKLNEKKGTRNQRKLKLRKEEVFYGQCLYAAY